MEITELLKKYNSDKVNPHTYGEAYEEIFRKFNREANLNILEIGIQKGGSLCAWRDYFPNARITGIDIVDEIAPEYRKDGIKYVICDVNEFRSDEMYDIVIDDGSHWLKDVIHTVSYFSRKLNVGGVIFVEDVQNNKLWFDVFRNILSSSLPYNEGYTWTISHYDATGKGREDNYVFSIQRIL